jgi:vacuolar-type H+-ATPase subunit E/Vma4
MSIRRRAEKTKKNIKDASDELAHRFKADIERARRSVAGRGMTTTQKTKSALREAGHRTAAGVDKTKRKLRGMV